MADETRDLREDPVIQAAREYEANATPTTRDALFVAVRAARALRFYSREGRLFLFRAGASRAVADCRSGAIAEALRDRLNTDLDAGWVPDLGA